MKIVIAGAGDMGTHLAKMLSGNGHDLTVVDVEPKALAEVGNLVDVVTVEGDTTQFSVLRKSGVRKCDLFIAVRSVENDNILSAVMAKQLGAKKAIARVDSHEYLEPNSKEIFIDMGIDYLFYPEQIAAREVINLLGHTSSTEYIDFAAGKLSLVAFRHCWVVRLLMRAATTRTWSIALWPLCVARRQSSHLSKTASRRRIWSTSLRAIALLIA